MKKHNHTPTPYPPPDPQPPPQTKNMKPPHIYIFNSLELFLDIDNLTTLD